MILRLNMQKTMKSGWTLERMSCISRWSSTMTATLVFPYKTFNTFPLTKSETGPIRPGTCGLQYFVSCDTDFALIEVEQCIASYSVPNNRENVHAQKLELCKLTEMLKFASPISSQYRSNWQEFQCQCQIDNQEKDGGTYMIVDQQEGGFFYRWRHWRVDCMQSRIWVCDWAQLNLNCQQSSVILAIQMPQSFNKWKALWDPATCKACNALKFFPLDLI